MTTNARHWCRAALPVALLTAAALGGALWWQTQGTPAQAAGRLSGGAIAAFVLTGGIVAGAFGSLMEVYGDLLRGAGAAGLAAMPAAVERDGITWLRPWLTQPREAIESYLRQHRLRWIDDDSNADRRFARNRLRLDVWPALQAAVASERVL